MSKPVSAPPHLPDESSKNPRFPAELDSAPVASVVVAPGSGTEESDELEPPPGMLAVWLTMLPSWLLSLVFHLSILLLMGLMLVPPTWVEPRDSMGAVATSESDDFFDSLADLNPNPGPVNSGTDEIMQEGALEGLNDGQVFQGIEGGGPLEASTDAFSPGGAQRSFDGPTIGAPLLADVPLSANMGSIAGSGIEGRGGDLRKMLVASGGGSSASEAAVARALEWIVKHQLPDGGWSFDHGQACGGQCKNPANDNLSKARNGATAMALLPMLGAGQTHRVGKYQKQIENGLVYLIKNMKIEEDRGDLRDSGGRLYSHGLAAIALCEAYAMTKDKQLKAPAQAALNFTVFAQLKDGGWRYAPADPKGGDTSAVGWQVMALKSGKLAGLDVSDEALLNAEKFLTSMQTDDGAGFGYQSPGRGAGTTSAGWLSKMYLGTKRDDPKLAKGVQLLMRAGPAKANSYTRYYATQVMHHYGADAWREWNRALRDQLVSTQSRDGHEAGSWYYDEQYAKEAGRLYVTSMNTMMLEVYYRHLPLYNESSFGE